jgi:hypothetical protein
MADVVVMFTATPINKGVRDLLRIADLLGADNLEDSALALFDRLEKRMNKLSGQLVTTREERLAMQNEVQRFILRRTKSMLNTMVDRDPEAYRDDFGNKCRYPEHRSKTYQTGEDTADKKIAIEIRELAGKLLGLANLRSGIELPEGLRGEIDEDVYIRGRLRGARGLALYNLMARLRSSRAACIEHLLGTVKASERFHINEQIKAEETGNIIGSLKASAGIIQQSSLQDKLPVWLTDPEQHRRVVANEVAIYEKILLLAEQMSNRRERIKAARLADLLDRHELVIAFDSCLITLEIIRQLIEQRRPSTAVLVATGSRIGNKKLVNRLFAPGSTTTNAVALCSDAMSEGLNLQQASAVMLLDMPSVIRVAEQRVGRVDRMNSPHRQIEVWWPKDSEAFSLNADRKFFHRYTEVKEILGANLSLPENLIPEELQEGPATTEAMIRQLDEMERAGLVWDGLQDAFQPVRDLLSPKRGLVPEEVYREVRHSGARVVSTVSLVAAQRPWAFMAIAGADHGAPKWIFLDGFAAKPINHLDRVVSKLRAVLSEDTESRPMDKDASEIIERFLHRVLEAEAFLLSRKKQRALAEMELIFTHYLERARENGDQRRLEVVGSAKALLDIPANDQERPDLDAVAEAWLDLIRETWYERLMRRRRFKPLRLKDIRKDLKDRPMATERIAAAFGSIPASPPIHARVAAAIVGIPDNG